MPSPTMLELSRWQFAFTIIFHMTFPAITVGLAVFLSLVYGLYLRTHKVVYLQIFRFWKGIFAVGFALGVVAGAVITFEIGLDWGPFANATGPVIAPIIGMEVVTAFFLEAGFIGVMLYGDGRVKERTIFISTCLVALGTLLSTTWIMSANSWMQTPSGFTIVDGQFQPTSWREVIFNPSVVWRYPHMLVAVLISTAWLVGGIAAYYLIKGRVREFARRTLSLSLGVVAVLLPLQLDLGDHTAGYVIKYQPAKLEALEGNWTSTNTGYNVFAIPDMSQQRNKVVITVPRLGSYIAKDLSGNTPTPGLLLTAKADQPNMWYVFWGFRVMFYASLLMFAAALTGVVLRIRRKLYSARWFHKLLVWMTPAGVVAVIAGWVTAETGRQPFVVYGH
ncbi:MAG TPA: cytochrome ubiquinol oxidase subunit I, partial [Actinoplanes sp.]|nr:cytochrome ubiquinol oxidase subunit I [Actinoplanes sp.]